MGAVQTKYIIKYNLAALMGADNIQPMCIRPEKKSSTKVALLPILQLTDTSRLINTNPLKRFLLVDTNIR